MLNFDDIRNMYAISQEKIKDLFETFGKFLSGGEAHELLSIASEVTTATKVVKTAIDVQNWHMTCKIKRFVVSLETQQFDQRQFEELTNKYGQEVVVNSVILSLGAMRSEKQASAFAYLFSTLLEGDIDWKRFSELQNILEKLDPLALDEDFYASKDPSYRLVSVGLAYIQALYDGVKVVPNGMLYSDFEKYVVRPYRAEKPTSDN